MKHTIIGQREMVTALRSARSISDISDHQRAGMALRAMGFPSNWLDADELKEKGWEAVVTEAVDCANENHKYA